MAAAGGKIFAIEFQERVGVESVAELELLVEQHLGGISQYMAVGAVHPQEVDHARLVAEQHRIGIPRLLVAFGQGFERREVTGLPHEPGMHAVRFIIIEFEPRLIRTGYPPIKYTAGERIVDPGSELSTHRRPGKPLAQRGRYFRKREEFTLDRPVRNRLLTQNALQILHFQGIRCHRTGFTLARVRAGAAMIASATGEGFVPPYLTLFTVRLNTGLGLDQTAFQALLVEHSCSVLEIGILVRLQPVIDLDPDHAQ
ncbi:hypothetical protein D3C79_659110 [compost metagenome]